MDFSKVLFDNWAVVTTIGTLVWALIERAEKKKAERSNETTQQELREIRRRAQAPYLKPSEARVGQIYVNTADGNIGFICTTNPAVLSSFRQEVDKSQSEKVTDVLMLIENTGEAARKVTLTLNDKPVNIEQEADINSAHGLQFIEYPYDPKRHGEVETLVLQFESTSGFKDTHIYSTKHGHRILNRIDPT